MIGSGGFAVAQYGFHFYVALWWKNLNQEVNKYGYKRLQI